MKDIDQAMKDMFGETPAAFSQAMDKALAQGMAEQPASKARQENAPRRPLLRAPLLAALVLAATMAVAYAVGARFGLLDYLQAYFSRSRYVPEGFRQAAEASPTFVRQVGPITLTLEEAVADNHMLMYIVRAEVTDQTPAAVLDDDGLSMPMDPLLCRRLGVPQETFAEETGLPCYQVRAWVDGVEVNVNMEDYAYDEEGTLHLVGYYPYAEPLDPIPDALDCTMTLRVRLGTTEWRETVALSIPMSGVTARCTYLPVEDSILDHLTFLDAGAELTSTGAYVTVRFNAADTDIAEAYGKWFELTDAEGKPYPASPAIDSFSCNFEGQTMVLGFALGLEELPEEMRLAVDEKTLLTLRSVE